MSTPLTIVVGVTGGIAAYKAVSVIRSFVSGSAMSSSIEISTSRGPLSRRCCSMKRSKISSMAAMACLWRLRPGVGMKSGMLRRSAPRSM